MPLCPSPLHHDKCLHTPKAVLSTSGQRTAKDILPHTKSPGFQMPAPQTLRICLSQRSLTDFYFFFFKSSTHFPSFSLCLCLLLLVLAQLELYLHTKPQPLFFFYTTQENNPGKLPASQVTGPPLSKFTYFSHSELSPCQKLINPRRPPRNSHGELSALSVKRTASALWAPKSLTSTLQSASVA